METQEGGRGSEEVWICVIVVLSVLRVTLLLVVYVWRRSRRSCSPS